MMALLASLGPDDRPDDHDEGIPADPLLIPADPKPRRKPGRPRTPFPEDDAQAVLDLLDSQPNKRRRLQHTLNKQKSRRGASYTEADKVTEVRARRFNNSGMAVTADQLIPLAESSADGRRKGHYSKVVKVTGSGQWKRWLPEAMQKAAFSKGTLRQIAAQWKQGHGPTSEGKHSHSTIQDMKHVVALTIFDGTEAGEKKLVARSNVKPFDWVIGNHVFDESKLWYFLARYKNWSTLGFHSQISWSDDQGDHDEDIIRRPSPMTRYTAAHQWNILTDDPIGGLSPVPGTRPRARKYGTCVTTDSHMVNKLTLKHLRMEMPPEEPLLYAPCLQHHTGTTATEISHFLDIFTKSWTVTKTLSEGDFYSSAIKKLHEHLEDETVGLEVVDPAHFRLQQGDWGRDATEAIMNRCFLTGFLPSETEQGAHYNFEAAKKEFIAFFPYGWNRRRVLHPCPPGCCGPDACFSMATSLEKAKSLIEKVVFKTTAPPSNNKWTKLDPAFLQVTIQVVFFQAFKNTLELRCNIDYEDLVNSSGGDRDIPALDDLDEDAPSIEARQQVVDNQQFQGEMKRYGKRCLAFVGHPETKMYMLVWAVVVEQIMIIHYKLFKHVNFFSNSQHDPKRICILNFCHGCPDKSPVVVALCQLCKMVFDPNGQECLAPLLTTFGYTVHWPVKLVNIYQKSCLMAYCKLWRELWHRFCGQPWDSARIWHPDVEETVRVEARDELWRAPQCHTDVYVSQPVRGSCKTPEELTEPTNSNFMYALFKRCMATSTFGERLFATLAQLTRPNQGRKSLASVAADMVARTFDGIVQDKWHELLTEQEGSQVRSGLLRDRTAYTAPKGIKKCGWHCYVQGSGEDLLADSPTPIDNGQFISSKRENWSALDAHEKATWNARAKKEREEARGRGALVDQVKAAEEEAEVPMRPWSLSSRRGNMPGDWPLSRLALMATGEKHGTHQKQVALKWKNSCDILWDADPSFPSTVTIREPCKPGECRHNLTPVQDHRYMVLNHEIKLLLRHHGLPVMRPLCLEFRNDSLAVYTLLGDNHWTHELHCDIMSLRRLCIVWEYCDIWIFACMMN